VELIFTVLSKADQSSQEVRRQMDGELIFGRTPDSPVPMDGQGISRYHFTVKLDGDRVILIDTSANGTWLNGTRLAKGDEYPVSPSDVVQIGEAKTGYEIRIASPVAAKPEPAAPVGVAPITSEVPALSAEQLAPPPAKKSPLAFVGDMVNSFTGLEKFIIVVDVVGIVLLAWYFGS